MWWVGTLVMLTGCVVFVRWVWNIDEDSVADAWVRYDERVRAVRSGGRCRRHHSADPKLPGAPGLIDPDTLGE